MIEHCLLRPAARISAIALATLVCWACSDSTPPNAGFSGEYELALVNGQSLPAVYLVYGLTGATKEVLSGSLEFSPRGRVVDARHLRDNPTGGSSEEFHNTTEVPFRIEGEFVIIDRPNIDAPVAAYSDTGVFQDNVLYIDVRTVDGTPNQRRSFTYVKRE